MNLTNFLVREAITPRFSALPAPVDARDPEAVMQLKEHITGQMCGALQQAGCFGANDLPDIVRAVMARERIGTTGIGQGIAIPHTRHPAVDRLIGTLAIAPEGLPFCSLDERPAYVFVLLLSPHDQPGAHLRALEAVVRTMRNEEFVTRLRACQTREEIWHLLETAAPGW